MPRPTPAAATGSPVAFDGPSGQLPSAPWSIFWTAFLVRVLYMTIAHTYRFRLNGFGEHFQFGWEMGRIARALATGYGYADPFSGHTGPTAWVAPLFPLLLAGVFKLFGVYTLTSAWVILTINCFFSALTTRTIWEIAVRCFNLRVARWSAWLWALYPAAMQYAVRWVWEMSLTTLLFTVLLVLALRMRGIGDPPTDSALPRPPTATARQWAAFGALSGLIALSNPSLTLFLPVCGLWILMGSYRQRRQPTGILLAIVICVALIAPWAWRNWRAFHAVVPLRSNFGAELYLGNGPGAFGMLMEYDHPNQSARQLNLYKSLGEIRYSQFQGEQAKRIIRQQPAHFLALSLKRFYYFWMGLPRPFDHGVLIEYGRDLNFSFVSLAGLLGLGLAIHRRIPAIWLFTWAFLLVPLPYYFVSVSARFRHPLEPLITIFSVYLFQSATQRGTPRDSPLP